MTALGESLPPSLRKLPLGDLQAKESSVLLISILRQPDAKVGESSIHLISARSIGFLGPEVLPQVLELLESESLETRVAAIDTLGMICHPRAIAALARCMEKDEREIRLWAALSLSKIGEHSIPTLMNSFELSSDPEQVYLILDALVMIGGEAVIDPIDIIMRDYCQIVKKYFVADTKSEKVSSLKHMLQRIVSSDSTAREKAYQILCSSAFGRI